MSSLVACVRALALVASTTALELRLVLVRAGGRMRATWAWRNGRERAAMCGVIRC